MMKGITPIIAIIVLLLITVALAGVAWTYLQGYIGGLTSKSIEVTDYFCLTSNDAPVIFVANRGTSVIDVSEISVIDTSDGSVVSTKSEWTDAGGSNIDEIGINELGKWTDGGTSPMSCEDGCTFRVIAGGSRAQVARIVC
jgi:flagellin-like protein